MRKKIDLDKIKDPSKRLIAELTQLSRRHTYEFACEGWFFRVEQDASEKGELTGKAFYEFSCVSELWRVSKFTCIIRILECDSAIYTDEHREPRCGTLNLSYEPDASNPDPGTKHGHFAGLLVMQADKFAKLHPCLAQRDVRPTIRIVVHDSLKEWDGTEQVYCEQYAIEFRSKAFEPSA